MFYAHEENPRSEHQCDKCNKCFFERHELSKHVENFHEMNDNLICEECSEEFSTKNDYKVELFWLLSFQGRDTKLDRFLPKNQYSKRKLLYFVN